MDPPAVLFGQVGPILNTLVARRVGPILNTLVARVECHTSIGI